ncbi:MAG: mismatch repair protein MutL [Planctomycetota bacterium]
MRAPPEIRRLPDHLANQIAAGEVVERPASAVKELVENSLDAGATRITVRLEQGGRRLIEIEDDGHGMHPADLRLAVDRHATSKLVDAEGLFRIATLGFRGEALPSIAAVSALELVSRPHAVAAGHRLAIEGGRITADGPAGGAPGTRISVRNLFWNVPARLKFLKSESAESGHATDAVLRLALGHPTVAFRLEIDGREALDLPAASSLIDRIRQAFGGELADSLLPVEGHGADGGALAVAGFIAHPREARPTSRRQFLFLNGRFVKDRILLAALREGCAGFMEPRLHAAAFLHLDIDPSLVDVNVHPAKAEVRFVREGEVFALIRNAVARALQAGQGGFQVFAREVVRPAPAAPAEMPVRPVAPPPAPAIQERFLPIAPQVETPPAPATTPERDATGRAPRPAAAEPVHVYQAPPPPRPPGLPAGVRRVLQLRDSYLLIETVDGIRLVDQHALHEKALFLALGPEATRLDLGGRQELAVPIVVTLSAAEAAACAPLLPALADQGIVAERLGPIQIRIDAHPARLRRLDWTGFFTDLAADGTKAVDGLRERIAHRLACRAAVKANQRLSPDEQIELVDLLYRVEGLEHCPHGRPTTLDLPWADLDRRFQR